MYLHYRWSGGGDANDALRLFHTHRQRQLVHDYQQKLVHSALDQLVWNSMVDTYFPNGIWPATDVQQLDSILADEQRHRRVQEEKIRARQERQMRQQAVREDEAADAVRMAAYNARVAQIRAEAAAQGRNIDSETFEFNLFE